MEAWTSEGCAQEVVVDGKGHHDDDGDDVTYELSAWYEPLR